MYVYNAITINKFTVPTIRFELHCHLLGLHNKENPIPSSSLPQFLKPTLSPSKAPVSLNFSPKPLGPKTNANPIELPASRSPQCGRQSSGSVGAKSLGFVSSGLSPSPSPSLAAEEWDCWRCVPFGVVDAT